MIFNKIITKTVIVAIAIGGLLVASTAQAGQYGHWRHHHHSHNGFGPGIIIGAAFGVIAGAAIASAASHSGTNNNNYYYNNNDDYDDNTCYRRTFIRCQQHYGYYGPVRSCVRVSRWVC